jgi:abortive infection bacteriophage resistance protein
MGSVVPYTHICTSCLGGKKYNKKFLKNTREKSEFVLLEFIDFGLVTQYKYEKLSEKNKSSIASCYDDIANTLIKHLTLYMI